MANYKLLLNHIATFEGGLSADPRDTCSKQPSDYVMPTGNFKGYKVHTNKGICFMTWRANAPSLGLDASTKGFINMTKSQWEKIIKVTFWDKLNLDKVNSQKIAELIFESTWASGFGGSRSLIEYMQKLIGADTDGKIGNETIAALNSKTASASAENSLFKNLWDYRLGWYQRLAASNPVAYGSFLKGWTNRMNALFSRAKTMVSENALGVSAIAVIGLGAFFLYKYYKA